MAPKPPFTAERWTQIETQKLPDYAHLSTSELQTEMRRRDLEVASTEKARLVKALKGTDRRDTNIYMTWKTEDAMRISRAHKIKERAEAMLASKFKAEPGRKGFIDLPLENRLVIYDLALFGTSDSDLEELKLLYDTEYETRYDAEKDSLLVKDHGSRGSIDMFSTLNLLYALSKDAREEARGVFWAGFSCRLHTSDTIDSFELAQRFLLKASAAGSASITRLPLVIASQDLGHGGFQSFKELPALLQPCIRLKRLDLELGLNAIFWNERNMLFDHSLSGRPFRSPNLEEFVNMFQSLPCLHTLNIKIIPGSSHSNKLWRDETDRKRQFVFSGLREMVLNLAIYERFNGNHRQLHRGKPRSLNGVVVWLDFEPYVEEDGGSEMRSFVEWLNWRDKKVKQLLKVDHVLKAWKMSKK